MDSETPKLKIFFFPFVGGGHMIPMIDLARLFASHGAKSTILTLPTDADTFHKVIHRDRHHSGLDIHLHTLPPPPTPVLDMSAPPFTDTSFLRQPLLDLLLHRRPDCLVADTFHRWLPDLVDPLGIPRVIFNGNCCFSRVVEHSIRLHQPHLNPNLSDSEPFLVPNLPHKIHLTKSQLPVFLRTGTEFPGKSMRAEQNSLATVVNSFYELEADYVNYVRGVMGKKVFLVGPVSLFNKTIADRAERGQNSAIDDQFCLKWLDSKPPNSVIYVSFGSLARLSRAQIKEIAFGLESCYCHFVWVIGKVMAGKEDDGELLPEGFEERMKVGEKGLVIRGWAPQLLILEHPAVGGFVTHCGWNSTLEGICAGVPMVTWPLSAEQFYNEKLVTEVLRTGVGVGSREWASWDGEREEVVGREEVAAAVGRVMGDWEEVEEMRRRAGELAEKARRAVEEGGSSYNDAEALIEELRRSRQKEVGEAA